MLKVNSLGRRYRSTTGYIKPAPGEWILRDGWYWPENRCKRGHEAPRNKFDHCMQCIREYRASKGHFINLESNKRWRENNKARVNELRRMHSLRRPELRMLNAARKTAKDQGLPFNLCVDDVVVPTHCPVLGMLLVSVVGPRRNDAPSLDRIIPSLGYVKGNVIVISWRANRIKADATVDELRRVAEFYQGLTSEETNPARRRRPDLPAS